MTYTISGVDPAQFAHLYGMDDEALAEHKAVRRLIGEGDAFPERIELRDTRPGEHALLVNYTHLPAANPYHARYAIFIREGATEAALHRDTVPPVLATRLISLRAFDGRDWLAASDVVPGDRLEPVILDFLACPEVAYLHAHFAGPGCFAARIDRD